MDRPLRPSTLSWGNTLWHAYMAAYNIFLINYVVPKSEYKAPTKSASTQVSFFRESYRFQERADTVVTAWEVTGRTCEFLFADNMDMYVVKKPNSESEKVKVWVLTWESRYRRKERLVTTPLDEVVGSGDTWTFLLTKNLDLICIHKSGTESTKTECWRLLHGDGTTGEPYSSWSPQTDRRMDLPETDDAWEFLLAPKTDDLYAIHKYEPGATTSNTKIKVLHADGQWTKSEEFTTMLPQTDYNYSFCLTADLDLVAVQKSRFPFSADMASI